MVKNHPQNFLLYPLPINKKRAVLLFLFQTSDSSKEKPLSFEKKISNRENLNISLKEMAQIQ